jgi:oligopeptidase A
VVAVSMAIAQSKPLYETLVAMRNGPGWEHLNTTRQRIVLCSLRDAELSGVALSDDDKPRFNANQQRLAELSTSFSNNVLDATKAFSMTLTKEDEVSGLPDSLLDRTAASARSVGETDATAKRGPWRITLDFPCFGPFLKYSARRDLREQIYRAYITRASSGETDNGPNIEEILKLRCDKAAFLGFTSYADLSLAEKMASSPAAVRTLLEELRQASWQPAHDDIDELRRFAAETTAPEAGDLKHWDIAYWAERMRQQRFGIDEEALRPYFPLPRVLQGLFDLASRLFGISIEPADGQAPVWHQDVQFYRVHDEGQPIAAFFLDPYSRPADKRGGAWMDECTGRSRLYDETPQGGRLPVAYLVCNGTPPVEDRPSLMTFREVETLFHEFGHGLQHMLTHVDEGFASGIRNIEWDAVELPSQFMENWCYHRPTMERVSGHFETGQPLPVDLFDKLCAARTFLAGSGMLRQLDFALTDLALHDGYVPVAERTPNDLRLEVARNTTVLPPLEESRFLNAFSHIFAGGYAAGYYSYKWAEVLSADAFAAFEEVGLDDAAAVSQTGGRFRSTVLGRGGSRHPMDVFREFRGREPSTTALLQHNGLI